MSAPMLLDCPFCGSAAEVTSYFSCDCCGKAYNGAVSCKNSDCGAGLSHFDNDEQVVTAWNRRALRPAPHKGPTT